MSKQVSRVTVSSGPRRATRVSSIKDPARIAGSTSSMPRASARVSVRNGKLGHSIRVSGREYIGNVPVPSGGDLCDKIYLQRPNVAGPVSTRLRQYSEIFERWRPYRYRYVFTSTAPTSTPGAIILASEPDPATLYVSGETGLVARLRTLEGSQIVSAWQSTYCDLSPSRDYTSLWTYDPTIATTEADRLDQAGTFVLACVAKTGLAEGTDLGVLELDYDIEFFSPRLQDDVVEHGSAFFFDRTTSIGMMPTPDGATQKNVFESIMLKLKSMAASGARFVTMAAIIRLFTEYGGNLGDRNVVKLGGFPPGHYSLTVTFCYNGYPIQMPASAAITGRGCTYTDRFSLDTNTLYDYSAVNGVTYPQVAQLNCEFGSRDMACYLDYPISITMDCITDLFKGIEFILHHSGSKAYYDVVSSSSGQSWATAMPRGVGEVSGGSRPVPPIPPQPTSESKEAKDERRGSFEMVGQPDIPPPLGAVVREPPPVRTPKDPRPPGTSTSSSSTLLTPSRHPPYRGS